jgi:hypothetical protein
MSLLALTLRNALQRSDLSCSGLQAVRHPFDHTAFSRQADILLECCRMRLVVFCKVSPMPKLMWLLVFEIASSTSNDLSALPVYSAWP